MLPALPSAWPSGTVRGLRARGGFVVDVSWKDGKLGNATVNATRGGVTRVRYGANTRDVRLASGEVFRWDGN